MCVLDTRDALSSLKSIKIHDNYFLMAMRCLVIIYMIYINNKFIYYYESIYYYENNRIALI